MYNRESELKCETEREVGKESGWIERADPRIQVRKKRGSMGAIVKETIDALKGSRCEIEML